MSGVTQANRRMEWGSIGQLSHKPLRVLLQASLKEMQGVISPVGKMHMVCVNKQVHPESSSGKRNDDGEPTPYRANKTQSPAGPSHSYTNKWA